MKNLFFLFIFIFFGGAVFAGNPETTPSNGGLITPTIETICTLPAPQLVSTTYHLNGSVSVTWSSVVYAIGYRVELYDVLNPNNMLYSYVTTGTTTTFLLPTGMNIVYKIRAQCASGFFSENFLAGVLNNGGIGIIVELVNNGYQAPVPANGWGDPIQPNIIGSDITLDLAVNKAYRITVDIPGEIQQEIFAYATNAFSTLTIYITKNCNQRESALLGNYSVLPTTQTYSCNKSDGSIGLRLCNSSTSVTMYSVLSATPSIPNPKLNFAAPLFGQNVNIQYFEIPILYDCNDNPVLLGGINLGEGSGDGKTKEHSDNSPNTTDYTLTAAPNPFTDHLTVLLEATGTTDLQLVDMSGKVWKSQTTEQVAGDLAYIETTDMPVGIYLLRVQTSNGIITKKVVKIAQ